MLRRIVTGKVLSCPVLCESSRNRLVACQSCSCMSFIGREKDKITTKRLRCRMIKREGSSSVVVNFHTYKFHRNLSRVYFLHMPLCLGNRPNAEILTTLSLKTAQNKIITFKFCCHERLKVYTKKSICQRTCVLRQQFSILVCFLWRNEFPIGLQCILWNILW